MYVVHALGLCNSEGNPVHRGHVVGRDQWLCWSAQIPAGAGSGGVAACVSELFYCGKEIPGTGGRRCEIGNGKSIMMIYDHGFMHFMS